MVALTVALGTLTTMAMGQLVLTDVANGLVEERRRTAFAETEAAVVRAQELFDGSAVTDPAAEQRLVDGLLPRLEGPGSERLREVVLVRSAGNDQSLRIREPFSESLLPSTVTADLRAAVGRDPSIQHSQVLQVRSTGPDDGEPAIAVGSRVLLPLSGEHDLFLVFRMDQEQRSLALVERTLLLGGLVLVLLVGGVAWLVTRLVVQPVREAARTAQRLAAGELDERMTERGEDDLALLSHSYNVMAASLQRQITQLEDLSLLQQRFVSDVSHELRTPLTTMRMAADVLHDQRADFGADTSRSIELLHAQIDRFEQLLGDLLEVSRFDAGAAELDADLVDVVPVVRQCMEVARPIADRRGVRLRLRHPDLPVMAELDRRRVARVVRNLVTNAVEHADGSDVVVTVAADPHAVAVGVRDHGVGLADTELERVFDRFWRADPARARTSGGTGLGLAISLDDARLHGGRIAVWGAPGRGANFVLTVPRRVGADPGAGPIAREPVDTAPDSEDVLRANRAGAVTAPPVAPSGSRRPAQAGR